MLGTRARGVGGEGRRREGEERRRSSMGERGREKGVRSEKRTRRKAGGVGPRREREKEHPPSIRGRVERWGLFFSTSEARNISRELSSLLSPLSSPLPLSAAVPLIFSGVLFFPFSPSF
eukprot:scaffold24612_cov31-Tisochrysis_lutea.AAC.1